VVEAPPITITDEPRPLLRLHQGRLEISLNPVSSFVAACVLLLLLVVSYQMGTLTDKSDTDLPQAGLSTPGTNSIEDAIKQTPNSAVLDVKPNKSSDNRDSKRVNKKESEKPAVKPSKDTAPKTTDKIGQRIPGMMYVILESFKEEDYQQAHHAQTWLSDEKNVMTTLEKRGDRWVLISMDEFGEKKQADEYGQAIVLLGKEYNKEFAGKVAYNFRSPYIFTEKTTR